ncbi:SusC/RagA family TonB-linked outer membrane protein [Fodinibius sp.]|uniref:SusC/RagA family TonB-linked outer membrane protein n=1 Tax=Fodinibius sp. TaxID=1872440 RepID=UPI00356522F0
MGLNKMKNMEGIQIMKKNAIGIILLMICFLPVTLIGGQVKKDFAQNDIQMLVKGDEMQVTLEESLDKIEEKFDVNILFRPQQVRNKYVSRQNSLSDSLASELEEMLTPLNMTFEQVNSKNFIIYDKNELDLEEVVQETITGEVTDAQSGETLPGVNVMVKGTTTGTSTDSDGSFELTVESLQDTLIFSFVGYQTQEMPINGRTEIDVLLQSQAVTGDELVVTAFGIERETRQISYSSQDVGGEDLESVGNSNVVNSLQGKIAGVTIRQTSGAPGSSHDITIRGSRSLLGGNEPLYVIDGLPVSGGSRAIDINPSDIESLNVLKGPTASALYGLRASNGAIVIQTKMGEGAPDAGPLISFESNYSIEEISMLPETQTTYMQGENGEFNPYSAHSWGPRIDTIGTYTNQLGEEEVAAVYDNDKAFFQTGGISNSNLSISNALEKGNYAISLGYTDQEGIIRTTGLQRMNVKLAGNYDLLDNFSVSTSINYINTQVDEQPTGSGSNWWAAFAVPVSYDLAGKPIHESGNQYKQINFRGSHDNLFWMTRYNNRDNNTSRILGNVNFNYEPIDWLSINYRLGIDEYSTNIKSVLELGSGPGRTDPPSGGSLSNYMQKHRQINSNLMVTLNRNISENFNTEFTAGSEFYDIRTTNITGSGNDFVIGGFHHISNAASQSTGESLTRRRVVGFYGNLEFSWQNAIYVNATGRNDIVSNMPSGNRSFFYPSIGTGIVFTDLMDIPENLLNFGKLRASVAEVGQAGPVHSSQTIFNAGGATGGFSWPYEGLNAFSKSGALNSSDLRTENTTTVEVGADLRFFEGRLGLDYTFYDSRADGQIYRVPIAVSTGYSSELRNAGEMSVRGHEIVMNVNPVETTHINWDFTTNFTTYVNKVEELAEGIEELELGGFRTTQVAIEGEEYPSLRGTGYARDPGSGEIVVDGREFLPSGDPNPTYGMPLRAPNEVILGTAQPDFEVGFINRFSYNNFTLSAQVDWRRGGQFSSGQNRLGRLYGVNIETENREEDYIHPGKKGYYQDGELVVEGDNDITIQRGQRFWQSNQDPINESNVFDATYVRLREIKLSYNLPNSFLDKFGMRSATVYLVGRNLWTEAAVPHFDPEMFNNSATESYNSYPQTKGFGGGIQIDL